MKPILFSTPMVGAILDGQKTMTRRVVKPQPKEFVDVNDVEHNDVGFFRGELIRYKEPRNNGKYHGWLQAMPFKPKYQSGDILWVRETWNEVFRPDGTHAHYIYKASSELEHWRPSIFMPKTAARIFLKVTEVRCERLQDISYDDCLSEGMHDFCTDVDTLAAFQELWQELNAKRGYGWDVNPWVWVISFERCDKPKQEG